MLPSNINELNLSQALLDIHNFLKEHPYQVWKTRPDNTPLRTIKTILHSLAKLKGNNVSLFLLLFLNKRFLSYQPGLQLITNTQAHYYLW